MQKSTYKAALAMDLILQRDDSSEEPLVITKRFGALPMMVGSKNCHLRNMSRDQLVNAKEDSNEFGGVFICNGIERIIRMLIQPRRHFIMAMNRGAFRKRGPKYTEFATVLRYPTGTPIDHACHRALSQPVPPCPRLSPFLSFLCVWFLLPHGLI